MTAPTLPNDKWVASTKMRGWAVCFDESDTKNFLRKMRATRGRWEPFGRLTVEELVEALDTPGLERMRPIIQKHLDEIHAHLSPAMGELVDRIVTARTRAGVRACGHLKGGCEQCHQCLLDAGKESCSVCEPALGVNRLPGEAHE